MAEGRVGGFAPGNYFCHCYQCGKQFDGDKRAFECKPCAIKRTGLNPCVVCGGYADNEVEPRFGYTTCHEHRDVPPTQIGRANA